MLDLRDHEFRTVEGAAGLCAYQLGRDGRPTGGWRVERNGKVLCEVLSEIDARILMHALAPVTTIDWHAALMNALADMDTTPAIGRKAA